MSEKSIIGRALEVFNEYAGMAPPDLPIGAWQCLQVQLARWQNINFGAQPTERMVLGVNEETGELAEQLVRIMELGLNFMKLAAAAGRLSHAVLKHGQGIRGMDDTAAYKKEAGDAIADIAIYSMNCATGLRLDYETLVFQTAIDVMGRDWTRNKEDGSV